MKFLKKEITTKKTVGQELIDTVISAVCFTIIVYLCLSSFNEIIQTILNTIKSGEITALSITMILFPIIMIISILLKLSIILVKLDNKK